MAWTVHLFGAGGESIEKASRLETESAYRFFDGYVQSVRAFGLPARVVLKNSLGIVVESVEFFPDALVREKLSQSAQRVRAKKGKR